MKIPYDLQDFRGRLLDLNNRQVAAVRHEADAVKSCFTNQAHQTMVVSAVIMGVGVNFVKTGTDINWFVLALGAAMTMILCLATANVGCHKYNTANRSTGYQIHLARVIDYYEVSPTMRRLSHEILRTDWEEAMFAWRVIQPQIFDYFYFYIKSLGICFVRCKWRGVFWKTTSGKLWARWKMKGKIFLTKPNSDIGSKSEEITDIHRIQKVRKYPWYDSAEILASDTDCRGVYYYPGMYLKKKLFQLNVFATIAMGIMILAMWKSYNDLSIRSFWSQILLYVGIYSAFGIVYQIAKIIRNTAWRWSVRVVIVVATGFLLLKALGGFRDPKILINLQLAAGTFIIVYANVQMTNNNLRRRLLESGLLSIQSNAFVWRIITMCMLVARERCFHRNLSSENPKSLQLYRGYTSELGRIAASLPRELHRVHSWLAEQESWLLENPSKREGRFMERKRQELPNDLTISG